MKPVHFDAVIQDGKIELPPELARLNGRTLIVVVTEPQQRLTDEEFYAIVQTYNDRKKPQGHS